jgi:hypothetical protein
LPPRRALDANDAAYRVYPEFSLDHHDATQPLDAKTEATIASKLRNGIAEQERRLLLDLLRENAVIEILGANSP